MGKFRDIPFRHDHFEIMSDVFFALQVLGKIKVRQIRILVFLSITHSSMVAAFLTAWMMKSDRFIATPAYSCQGRDDTMTRALRP